MASSIESLLGVNAMAIKELCRRLLVIKENDAADEDNDSGKLLLIEEEWRSRFKSGGHDGCGSSSGGDQGKSCDDKRSAVDGSNASGWSKKDDTCRYCGKKGHWARECCKKKREEVHQAKVNEEADPAMLLAEIELDTTPSTPVTPRPVPVRTHIFFNKENTNITPVHDAYPINSTWYLYMGATNHMT